MIWNLVKLFTVRSLSYSTPMGPRITCLLVDDDLEDQEIFGMALQEVGISCSFAGGGEEALMKLRADEEFIPHYIFLDLNMPRMSGKECLIELKKIERLEQVPIIIYSTSSDPDDIDETKKLGAAGYIVKPSNISALILTLNELFQNHKSRLS